MGTTGNAADTGRPLIALCPADQAPDPAVLQSRGGFTWFYVDLVDGRGGGATVIWSWGLPFLPGYASAARGGRPQLPIDRPSVNVVVYGGGRERFYLLSELSPDQCHWSSDGRSWRLGDCIFSWTDTPGADGEAPTRIVEGVLDLPLPTGGRVTGRLRLAGALRRESLDPTAGQPDHPCTHEWAPMLAASRGCLELSTPDGTIGVRGRAYHDRNSASQPLQALGIQSWWWGRLALPGRDLIFYRLIPSQPTATPRDLVVEVGEDGRSRIHEDAGLQFGRLHRSAWGLRWPSSATFADPDGRPVRIEVGAVPDKGPFYQRYLLHGHCDGEDGYGIGESLVPDRVDTDLLRPLVRMRVHQTTGPNSMWLPLFSGDSGGRWARLLGRAGPARA